METILLLAAVEADQSLGCPALEALAAAKSLASSLSGSRFLLGLFGEKTGAAANQLAGCGAEKILAVTGSEFAQPRYASDAAAGEVLCRATRASIVIAPATSRMSRFVPGLAQRLGGNADTHVVGINAAEGKISVSRWYYRQRMEAVLERRQRPWFILVDTGTQPAWEGAAGTVSAEAVSVTLSEAVGRTTVLGIREVRADAQTIRPDATLLFVTGAGWTKKQADGQAHVAEAESLITNFLKLTRASLGSSKSLVDLGGEGQAVLSVLTHLNQVGQTGSTPRHPRGLATCCHGEEPHTVGWRFINDRRAINLDPNCGWARGKADVLYVADAFAVMKKVNELLGENAKG